MNRSILLITGTDTGVGKTVLAALLTRHLRDAGIAVAALKPVCSGGRDDARRLRTAADGVLTLDEINPWHFRSPLTPLLAARHEHRKLELAQVAAQVRRIQRRFPVVLVEGAGGLLSPLGEDFDSRDLLLTLRATPIVVCPNRLGAINQTLLVLAALPRGLSRKAQVVLTSLKKPDAASLVNPRLLAERLGRRRVHVLPWLNQLRRAERTSVNRRVRQAIGSLVGSIGF